MNKTIKVEITLHHEFLEIKEISIPTSVLYVPELRAKFIRKTLIEKGYHPGILVKWIH
jgi:hypothetical protein